MGGSGPWCSFATDQAQLPKCTRRPRGGELANVAGLWPHQDNIPKLRGNNLKTNYTHSSLLTVPPEHMLEQPALAVALAAHRFFQWAKCSLSGGEAHELLHAHTRSLPVESSPPRGSCTLWQLCLVPDKNYTRVQGRPCKARYCWSEHHTHCRGQVGPGHGVAQTMVSERQRLLVD